MRGRTCLVEPPEKIESDAMTGLQEEKWEDIYAIRAMKDYIQTGGSHAQAVSAELRARLARVPIGKLIMNDVLSLGQPDLIRILIERIGEAPIASGTDYNDEPIDPLTRVCFEKTAAHHRIEVFEMLLPLSPRLDLRAPRTLVKSALTAGDRAFLDRIAAAYPELDLDALKLDLQAIDEAGVETAGFWKDLLSGFAPDSAAIAAFAMNAVKQQSPRAVATLMTLGLRIRPALDAHRSNGNPWPERLRRRIESHHAEMQMMAGLPEVEGIFAMEKKELQHLLAGLSPKEEKAAEKKRKHEAWLARQAQQKPEEA